MCDTPVIVNYDADVLFEPWAYEVATNAILEDKADMVYPYAGPFINCKNRELFIKGIRKNYSFEHITKLEYEVFNKNSVGGAIFWNRDKFIDVGMENENFISWGHEDFERVERAKKLGARVARLHGNLLHVSHHRSAMGQANHDMYKHNEREFIKVRDMSPPQLREYVESWEWRTNNALK
jgi:hypothetical protein